MLKKSKYVHLCENNIVWHSLLGKSMNVSDELYKKLKKNISFDNNCTPEVNALIHHGFISSEKSDENLLKEVKRKIKDSGFNNLFLIMTNQCNLACKYCFYQNSHRLKQNKMSFETAKKAVDLFVKNRTKNEKSLDWFSQITFYGGEPLLNFECIEKITDYIQLLKNRNKLSSKTQLVINTNGTLITEKVLNWARKYNVQIQISIDGNKDVHNKNRIFPNQKGSYEKTVQGLKKLVDSKIDILPLVTVTDDNLADLPNLIYDLCKKYQLKYYGMNLLIDLGIDPIKTYPETAAKQMVQACRKTKEMSVSDDSIDAIFQKIKHFDIVKQSCGISRKMTVFPDGKIFSCQAISDNKKALIGNVNTGLTNIDNIQYWRNYSRFNNSKCLKCKYVALCGGGCVASAFFRHKRLGNIDEHYCRWIKYIMSNNFDPKNYLVKGSQC